MRFNGTFVGRRAGDECKSTLHVRQSEVRRRRRRRRSPAYRRRSAVLRLRRISRPALNNRPAGRPTDRLKTEWTINRPNGRANKLSKCLLTWIARPLRNQIIFPARFNSDVFLSSSAVPFSSDMVPVRATTVHEKTRDIYKVGSINLFREGIFSLHSLSSFSFFFSSFPLPFPSS